MTTFPKGRILMICCVLSNLELKTSRLIRNIDRRSYTSNLWHLNTASFFPHSSHERVYGVSGRYIDPFLASIFWWVSYCVSSVAILALLELPSVQLLILHLVEGWIEDSPREIPLSSKIIRRGCLVSQPAAKPFFPGRHEIINSKGTFKTIGGYCSMWYSMRTHLIYGYVRPLKRSWISLESYI